MVEFEQGYITMPATIRLEKGRLWITATWIFVTTVSRPDPHQWFLTLLGEDRAPIVTFTMIATTERILTPGDELVLDIDIDMTEAKQR